MVITSMDSYNYFVSGFVKEVGAKVFSNCMGYS